MSHKTLFSWLGIAILLASSNFCTLEARDSQQVDERITNYQRSRPLYKKASKQFVDKNYKQAIRTFRDVLEISPEDSEATLYLGVSLYYTADYEEALKLIGEAKEKNLNWRNIMYDQRVRAYSDNQELMEKARQDKQDIMAQLAAQNLSEQQRATLQDQLSQVENRIATLNGVTIPLQNEPIIPEEYYFHCSNVYLKLNQLNEAYVEYLKAVEIEAEYGDAHNNLAYLYYVAKRYEEAQNHLDLAKRYGAKVNPGFEIALKELLKK